ncbi:MAG: methionine ABC transporter ATP-binding protein [Rhodospirillales bacterium]|nr:methionine ABC transporter ATP-binding protein [Rhodospirillales bacterium]
MVRFERVGKVFQGPGGRVTALSDVSLSVRPGEIFGIIGRSGAGKSTLIRCINALERPTAGRIIADGEDITQLDRPRLVALRRRVGMIFQHFNLLSSGTVYDNVALPLEIAGLGGHAVHSKVRSLLDLVGLFEKRASYPANLSGGQKQRVGIARALVHDPRILLCDEATSALDPETTLAILALLKEINRRLGVTIILITHEMAVIKEICDRVAVLNDGVLVEEGAVADVFATPQSEVTRGLLRVMAPDLPDVIVDQIRSAPVAGGDALIRLRFAGVSAGETVLSELARRLSLDVRLVHGRIDYIGSPRAGNLVVALPVAGDNVVARAVGLLRSRSINAEVLGYVAGHA